MNYSFNFNRPLSPHIFIYKPNFPLLKSIFHRGTGLILTLFFFLFFIFFKFIINPLLIPSFASLFFLTNNTFFLCFSLFFLFFIYHFISGLFFIKNNFFL
uniref:succinate dehydrogenase subunit 3 n=1 Tax=Campylaephora sungminbooi TaxID=1896769 RepID=UPI002E79A16A|nr:succinate dehydrogenase subunit 3 [Campylaephora sungminbooi]WQF69655.1 succinate dehydrogenase subunit 3 [Campylaephora sungminbooi]